MARCFDGCITMVCCLLWWACGVFWVSVGILPMALMLLSHVRMFDEISCICRRIYWATETVLIFYGKCIPHSRLHTPVTLDE